MSMKRLAWILSPILLASACSASHHASSRQSTTTTLPATIAADRYPCTYGLNEASMSADGLPNIAGATTDRHRVEAVLQADRPHLLDGDRHVSAVSVGEGFGRAWKGQNGGRYAIVRVQDYAILLHVASAADCPRGKGLPALSIDGVPIFYTVG
jgi:hypothetical protein